MRNRFRVILAMFCDVIHSWTHGRDIRSRWLLTYDFGMFRFIGIVPTLPVNRPRVVHLSGDVRVVYRFNKGDIYSIHEIWFERMYELPIEVERRGVLVDLGANVGITSLWLCARYGFRQVIAIEPSSGNVSVLRENMRLNGISATVLEAAVSDRDGEADFLEVSCSTNGRLTGGPLDESAVGGELRVRRKVRCLGMDSVLSHLPFESEIELLKVDIEGGESALLSGDTMWLARVRTIVIEFHKAMVDTQILINVIHESGFEHVSSRVSDAERGNTLEFFVRRGDVNPATLRQLKSESTF